MAFSSWLAVASVLVLMSGCVATPDGVETREPTEILEALRIGKPVRIDSEQPAREPAIVQAANGDLYVAGFWGFARHTEYQGTAQNVAQGPLLWKSTDGGASWVRLSPGTPVDGAISNSDLDLAVDPQGGLYMAALSYYSAPTPVPPPVAPPADPATTLSVVVGATLDGGESWSWVRLDQGPERSHPWVTTAPDGRVHVVWGDGQGIRRVVSSDRGASWTDAGRVHESALEAGGIVAAPGGTLAVRTTTISATPGPGDDGVVVSTDGGASWTFRALPGATRTGDTPRGFEPVAFDAAGWLAYAWADGQTVYLADSPDLGLSWRTTLVADEPTGASPFYPYLRGGPGGEVALTWFAQTRDAIAPRVARVTNLDGPAPTIRLGSFVEATGGTNHADYYQVTFLDDGGLAAAVPMTTPDAGQWFDFRRAD